MKIPLVQKIIVNILAVIKSFKWNLNLLIICLSISSAVYSQINDSKSNVAKVGNLKISEQEFILRLNFTPKEGIQDRSNSEGIKKELLYTLIAEKLWANEAIEKGYENHPSIQTAKRAIEKMFVRDALYLSEIKNKIEITPEEMSQAIERYSKKLRVTVFNSQTKTPITQLFNSLNNNKPLGALLASIDTTLIGYKAVEVSYGDLPVYIENIIYGLNKDEYTTPIEIENGWNLFYLNDVAASEKGSELDTYKNVSKILRTRKEDYTYQEYYSQFFKDKKIDADGKLFLMLSELINKVFTEKEKKGLEIKGDHKNEFVLDTYDLNEILESMSKEVRESAFLKFENDPINIENYLREISFTSFSVHENDIDTIKVYLNKKTKEFIKYELLAREGFRLGLDQREDVKEWVRIWYENFLFQFIKNQVAKTDDGVIEKLEPIKKEELFDKRNNKLFENYINETIELSEKFKYEINENIYSDINQGNINLFVMRRLGFGGTISGVPSVPPFIEWYLEKQKRDNFKSENAL